MIQFFFSSTVNLYLSTLLFLLLGQSLLCLMNVQALSALMLKVTFTKLPKMQESHFLPLLIGQLFGMLIAFFVYGISGHTKFNYGLHISGFLVCYRKFHSHILQFDGEGGWNLSPLDAKTAMTLRQEKAHLEAQLADVPVAQQRLQVNRTFFILVPF